MSNQAREIIDLAIDNGWPLRPVGPFKFINKNHAVGIGLDDKSHILESSEDLDDYPRGASAVALIPGFLDDFVCLDLDFKDEELKKEIFEICLARYKKEDLFLRIGHREKPGQLWFKCFAHIKDLAETGLDIIVKSKRCNAIGAYKDTDLDLLWPYKKPWVSGPDEMPIITPDLIDDIVAKITGKLGSKKSGPVTSSRHDTLVKYARDNFTIDSRPSLAIQKMMETDSYKDLVCNPRKGAESPHNEVSRIVRDVLFEKMKGHVYYNPKEVDEKDNSIMKFSEMEPSKVDENSFFDLIYRLLRRNQIVDNKKIAFAATLNFCSWLASLFCRYEGIAPNLMLLYVAESGGGKSSTTKIIKQLFKHIPELKSSFQSTNIGSTATVARFVSESPVCNLNIDEFSKVLKNSSKDHMGDLPEALCQWYSDFDDYGAPEAMVSLKNETNGIALGAKLVALMSTTPAVFNNFDESLFEQGLGRRLFPIIDNSFAPLKKNFNHNTEYFKSHEIQIIKKVVEEYIFTNGGEIFDTINISAHKFIKKSENGEVSHHQTCKKSRITHTLTSSNELSEYMKNEFIDEVNSMRRTARYFGSNIQTYLTNSALEHIKKLSAIHALFGKTMHQNMLISAETEVGMDSFEWAKKTFGHYVIYEAMESYDEIFNKKPEIQAKVTQSSDFLEYLSSKDIIEFTKSKKEVHNFFKDKKNSRLVKSNTINSLLESGKLELINKSSPDKRGAKFKVV